MVGLTEAFHFYRIYVSLKLHYDINGKYDYSKFGPLKNLKMEKFETDKDRFIYNKLAKRFNGKEEDFIDFASSLALRDGKLPYIRNVADEPTINDFFKNFHSNKLKLKYIFDLYMNDFNPNDLRIYNGKYPKIIEEVFLDKNIFIDIFYIFDIILNLSSRYIEEFSDDLLFQTKMNIYLRYVKLINIDLTYFRNEIRNKLATI